MSQDEADPSSAELDPQQLDLGYLALFFGMSVNGAVSRALVKAGYPSLKSAHGFLIQYLLTGAKSVGELAQLAGITQQAISKSVKEMAAIGLIEDVVSDDARVRRVALSKQGRKLVERGRAEREKLLRGLGGSSARDVAAARRVLLHGLASLSALDAIRQRKLRPL